MSGWFTTASGRTAQMGKPKNKRGSIGWYVLGHPIAGEPRSIAASGVIHQWGSVDVKEGWLSAEDIESIRAAAVQQGVIEP